MDILIFDYTKLNLPGIIIFITAFLIGIKFPDWDFKMKLRHRNILTHSPLILFFFYWIYMKNPADEFRYFIMGFSSGVGIHLIFDIFPRGWGGGSLLQTPFVKYSFKKNVSKMLLLLFIGISLGLTIKNTEVLEEAVFIFLFGIFMIALNASKEGKVVRPAGMYVLIMTAAAAMEYNEVAESVSLVYTYVQKTIYNLL